MFHHMDEDGAEVWHEYDPWGLGGEEEGDSKGDPYDEGHASPEADACSDDQE